MKLFKIAKDRRSVVGVGSIPEIHRLDFRRFCERALPHAFTAPWTDKQTELLISLTAAIEVLGLRLNQEQPRSSGTTTILTAACLWAFLSGRRHRVWFVAERCMEAETACDNAFQDIQSPGVQQMLAKPLSFQRCSGRLWTNERWPRCAELRFVSRSQAIHAASLAFVSGEIQPDLIVADSVRPGWLPPNFALGASVLDVQSIDTQRTRSPDLSPGLP